MGGRDRGSIRPHDQRRARLLLFRQEQRVNYECAACASIPTTCASAFSCSFQDRTCSTVVPERVRTLLRLCRVEAEAFCVLNKSTRRMSMTYWCRAIISQMRKTGSGGGRFLPAFLAPVALQSPIAQRYFPPCRVEAEKQGLHWLTAMPCRGQALSPRDLPDDCAGRRHRGVVLSAGERMPFRITAQGWRFTAAMQVPCRVKRRRSGWRKRARRLGGIELFERSARERAGGSSPTHRPGSGRSGANGTMRRRLQLSGLSAFVGGGRALAQRY
jgi:hypothetical protein